MSTEILIIIFNIVYFINNLFFLEFTDSVFEVKSNKFRKAFYSFFSSIVGTTMLVLFGSMSALGYCITLAVYICIIMYFYKKYNFLSKLASVLSLVLHIMVARAIISAVISAVSGVSIYELSRNPTTFWTILIFTSVLCSAFTNVIIYLIPKRFLRILGTTSELLIAYVALLILANIYMIANGNIYIHNIEYSYLQLHQIIASIAWLIISYVGLFMLVGFDIIKEKRKQLEKDIIFKQIIGNNFISLIEVNCAKDIATRFIVYGQELELPTVSYTEFVSVNTKDVVFQDDLEETLKRESISNLIVEFNSDKKVFSNELRIIARDGSIRWVRSQIALSQDESTGEIIAIIAYFDDIHDAKTKEAELKRKAQVDPLLGAFNKKASESHVKQHLHKHKKGVMFMIDLDNFKKINDNFGHAYGDDVLKEAYAKIVNNFRSDDIIGRVGGDEFTVFMTNNMAAEELSKKASAICKSVHKTYTKNNVSVELSCSVGIALCPEHGIKYDELYHKADLAMYNCKREFKNNYCIYTDAMQENFNQ